MHYKLTFKDKIVLFFKNNYLDKVSYLYPKVEKYYENFFKNNDMRLPYNYDKFIKLIIDNIIFRYENEVE